MLIGGEEINLSLKKHQQDVETWEKKERVQDIHNWAERFASQFKLKIGVPAFMVDRLRCTRYGHFRPGRDGFGLQGEVGINDLYIGDRLSWQNLATLLHELGHVHQEKTGKPGKGNYHNRQFRELAKTLGLIVDKQGHTKVIPPPSPFWDALQKYGVEVPTIMEPESVGTSKPGQSKLKLWICSCKPEPVRVRVAIPDFRAQCLKCGQLFTLKD